jgi:hypothetical protein
MGRTKHHSLERVLDERMEYQTFTIRGMVFRLTNDSSLGGGEGIV